MPIKRIYHYIITILVFVSSLYCKVIYPTVKDQSGVESSQNIGVLSSDKEAAISYTAEYDTVFLSLNRYERKKNITLAIDALQELKRNNIDNRRVVLVIAGGYDLSVPENVQYLVELMNHCTALKIPFSYTPDTKKMTEIEKIKHEKMKIDNSTALMKSSPATSGVNESEKHSEKGMNVHVVFRTSISGLEREALLERAVALLYTPDR
jgi:glycosyltransferase involved in cell wall biosynthesis